MTVEHDAWHEFWNGSDEYQRELDAHNKRAEAESAREFRTAERERRLVMALREIAWSNDSKWQQDRAKAALAELD